jgi:hypothetical protein
MCHIFVIMHNLYRYSYAFLSRFWVFLEKRNTQLVVNDLFPVFLSIFLKKFMKFQRTLKYQRSFKEFSILRVNLLFQKKYRRLLLRFSIQGDF